MENQTQKLQAGESGAPETMTPEQIRKQQEEIRKQNAEMVKFYKDRTPNLHAQRKYYEELALIWKARLDELKYRVEYIRLEASLQAPAEESEEGKEGEEGATNSNIFKPEPYENS